MWIPRFYSAGLLLILAAFSAVGYGEQDGVLRRQDPASSAPPPSSSAVPSTSAPASISSQASSQASSGDPSTQRASATTDVSSSGSPSSARGGTSSAASRAATSGGPSTLSGIVVGATATPIANSTYNGTLVPQDQIDGLPIQPSITPAIAVAGAIMIVTGIFYTLIGVKTPRLHIFFSTAYLFSLAVTVLVEYVMHPPISHGIQAAYFIAACVTGLIFGAIAMIFADVTEGLGCFLGGFSLSMWFLVLKPGGLITSTAGKAIFIACFTVSVFGFYISHYTRAYSIIGSTSFAGATVVVLGIDCFSRAGLKEFWLYIWNLNDALFPLNYEGPYPITRGIRVEIAAIIFIFALGVMSQMKVWKIVKKRREAKAAEQRRKDAEREQAEEALGRRIEADNEEERAMWDAVYSGKNKGKVSQLDSGIGTDAPSSTRKSSMSIVDVRSMPEEGMEMQDLNDGRSFKAQGAQVTVHVAQDDGIVEVPVVPGEIGLASTPRDSNSRNPSPLESQADGARSVKSVKSQATSTKSGPKEAKTSTFDPKLTLKATQKPKFVPLPFKVPGEVSSRKDDDDASSVATFAASDHLPDRSSKRISGSSLIRKLSGRSQRRSSVISTGVSSEALVVPHLDDDRASSVAATLDGISDKASSDNASASSRKPSPTSGEPKTETSSEILVTAPQTPLATEESGEPSARSQSEVDPLSRILKLTDPRSPSDIAHSDKTANPQAFALGPTKEALERDQPQQIQSPESVTSTEVPRPLARASLANELPRGASKVEMAFRTNEWAKHLDRADAPEFEDLKSQRNHGAPQSQTMEASAPVNVRELQQSAVSAESDFPPVSPGRKSGERAQLPSMNRSTSAESTKNPYRQPQSPRATRSNSQESQLAKTIERAPSQTSLVSSNGSQEDPPRPSLAKIRGSQSTLSIPRGLRSSSTPLVASPLASSPIQEDVVATFPPKFTPSTSHLMSQRDALVRSKPSSTSLLRTGSSSSVNRLTANSSPNASNIALNNLVDDDDDSMPLAQRKSLLQQQPSRTSLVQRTLSSGAVTPAGNSSRLSLVQETNSNNPYNNIPVSHANPPHAARPHNAQDPAAITSWRASLAQLPYTAESAQAVEMERRRSELLAEKQAQRRSRAVEAGQREQRDSVLGREMRRGSMLDAHREAMRRMQGEVNEKLKS